MVIIVTRLGSFLPHAIATGEDVPGFNLRGRQETNHLASEVPGSCLRT